MMYEPVCSRYVSVVVCVLSRWGELSALVMLSVFGLCSHDGGAYGSRDFELYCLCSHDGGACCSLARETIPVECVPWVLY
jgi:hypothetical protein